MPYETLNLQLETQIAILSFNRPEKRNAISPAMIDELLVALDEIERSPARVAILTGAGKAFCSGMDLESLQLMASHAAETTLTDEPAGEGVMNLAMRVLKGETNPHSEDASPASADAAAPLEVDVASSRLMADMFRRLYDFPKPLIAAVNGPAIAGGCGIATLCDFTLAAPEARFGYTEVRIGFIPAIVSVFLSRQIGQKAARDLLLTGRIVDGAEAHRLGLVTEIVPAEMLMNRSRQLAEQLIENSPASLAFTKRLLREFSRGDLDREIDLAVQENARIRATPDFREGLTAFLEKRPPQWQQE
jgi:methylglutaconyl-CoA hydratase